MHILKRRPRALVSLGPQNSRRKIRQPMDRTLFFYQVQLSLSNNTMLLVETKNYDVDGAIVNANKLKAYHLSEANSMDSPSLQEIHHQLREELTKEPNKSKSIASIPVHSCAIITNHPPNPFTSKSFMFCVISLHIIPLFLSLLCHTPLPSMLMSSCYLFLFIDVLKSFPYTFQMVYPL